MKLELRQYKWSEPLQLPRETVTWLLGQAGVFDLLPVGTAASDCGL
jgi:hypothetical protein